MILDNMRVIPSTAVQATYGKEHFGCSKQQKITLRIIEKKCYCNSVVPPRTSLLNLELICPGTWKDLCAENNCLYVRLFLR